MPTINEQQPKSEVPLQKPVATIPHALQVQMNNYAVKLRKDHPRWKPAKLEKAICKKFNVELE